MNAHFTHIKKNGRSCDFDIAIGHIAISIIFGLIVTASQNNNAGNNDLFAH